MAPMIMRVQPRLDARVVVSLGSRVLLDCGLLIADRLTRRILATGLAWRRPMARNCLNALTLGEGVGPSLCGTISYGVLE